MINRYGCAQDDVTELGVSDVYWAMYYTTVERSEVSRFTAPFLSDVGLSLLVPAARDSLWERMVTIFTPFTRDVWLITVAAAFVVSGALWVAESKRHDEVSSEGEGQGPFPST